MSVSPAPGVVPAGFFLRYLDSSGVYYSNGTNGFCGYLSAQAAGLSSYSGIPVYSGLPSGETYQGLCSATAPAPAPSPAPSANLSQSLLTSQTPSLSNDSDGTNVNYELGMKFSANVTGQVTAIRFYKSANESGVHTGKIYSSAGSLLASVVFGEETASGWQSQNLASPLAIGANTTYVVSVNTGNSYYVDTLSTFAAPLTNGNLTAPVGAGVYGPIGSMPTGVWNSSNYFRDVVFIPNSVTPAPAPTPAPTPTPTVTPSPGTALGSIKHGKDLTIEMVGPAAIGITSFVTAPPSSQGYLAIYDATAGSYIQTVNSSATYYGFTVNGPHMLIKGVSFSQQINVFSSLPLVMIGCKIRAAAYWSINPFNGAGPLYLLFSEAGGTDATSSAGTGGSVLSTMNAGGNVFYRNYISFGGDGFSIGSKNDQILENYVEKFNPSEGHAHNDGIQAAGNNDGMYIARNKILNDQTETSAINISGWGGGVAQYVTVDSNYLAGGGFSFYGPHSTASNHIVVTGNLFGYDIWPGIGYYGAAVIYWINGTGSSWTNNFDTKGNLIVP